jgi:hypothetical protein
MMIDNAIRHPRVVQIVVPWVMKVLGNRPIFQDGVGVAESVGIVKCSRDDLAT